MTVRKTRHRNDRITAVWRCNRKACTHLGHRMTLTRNKFDPAPICKGCKKPLCADKYRNSRRESRRNNCECGGYKFVHRRGSLLCAHGKGGLEGWSWFNSNCEEFAEWLRALRGGGYDMSVLDYIRHGSKRKILAGETPAWILNNKRARYIYNAVMSAPPWIKRADFAELEARRDWLTRCTGIKHVFDHDVPLSRKDVCGLTVPWNIKIIPHNVNNAKGNAWCQHHGELFDEPEQLRIQI